MIPPRKKRNSSKVNLILSAAFHSGLIFAIAYLAAREGYLGRTMKQLAVTMVKEKKPEPPKEKPPEPKPELPKPLETPKIAAAPPPAQPVVATQPPVETVPAAAPAAAVLSGFEFNDGAKEVAEMGSDPISLYKALVEHTLRTRWNKPEDIADDRFIAEAEVQVDREGRITDTRWLRGSGDSRWDNSVKVVLAATKTVGKAPPKGFPEKFTVRFDVESLRMEPTIQLSSR